MRTRKQLEWERKVLTDTAKHDRLVAAMLVSQFHRDRTIYDVFGNRCRCYMNDEGEWTPHLCPEHWREA